MKLNIIPLIHIYIYIYILTPSVLHPKSFTKTHHEHHTYGVMHVMKRIGEVFQLK